MEKMGLSNFKIFCCFWNPVQALMFIVFQNRMLTQELMIRKRERAGTKNNCWPGELVTIETVILPHSRITELPVAWKVWIKAYHTFLSCLHRKQTPPDKNHWPQEHWSRLIETRRLTMLKLHLEASQSQNCPQVGHTLLREHYRAPHYPLYGGSHSLEGIICPLPSKAVTVLFYISPKSLSPCFIWNLTILSTLSQNVSGYIKLRKGSY